MSRKHKRYSKTNFIFLILCIITSTIFTFKISTSRYIGEISAEENILAVPILKLSENTQITYSITDMYPGGQEQYVFSVSNVDGEQNNEVPLKYYFKIEMQTEIPLDIKLYDITGGSETELQITDNKSEEMEMIIVQEEQDKVIRDYKLLINWDSSNNSYEYAGKTIDLKITLEGEQIV